MRLYYTDLLVGNNSICRKVEVLGNKMSKNCDGRWKSEHVTYKKGTRTTWHQHRLSSVAVIC